MTDPAPPAPPGNVLDFQTEALGRLRTRVAALGEANRQLIDYARGHSGATAQIHAAVLAALDCESFEHLAHVITQDWVDMLGLDAVGLALVGADQAVRLSGTGIQLLAPDGLAKAFPGHMVVLRAVDSGSDVFGPAAPLIRSEALIHLRLAAPLPQGLLALGSRDAHSFEGVNGAELLSFLGGVVERCLTRWLARRP